MQAVTGQKESPRRYDGAAACRYCCLFLTLPPPPPLRAIAFAGGAPTFPCPSTSLFCLASEQPSRALMALFLFSWARYFSPPFRDACGVHFASSSIAGKSREPAALVFLACGHGFSFSFHLSAQNWKKWCARSPDAGSRKTREESRRF